MTDYLLQLCIEKDIELFYTNNPSPILSSYVQYGLRNIVAYSGFRSSSKELAAAVVNYYTQDNNKEENFSIIKEFLKKYFISGTYKIDSIEIVIDEETDKTFKKKTEEQINKEVSMVEVQKPQNKKQSVTQSKKEPKKQSKKQDEIDKKLEGEVTPVKSEPKVKKAKASKKSKTIKDSNEKNNIVEVNIKNITQKSFKKNITKVDSNELIHVDEDDILELDITIDPFNT